jgi:O-antigen/teichoic acid export membrane protein
MLGPMLGIAMVGQVSVATYLAEWLWYVPSILNNLLFAASAADARTRQVEQIARATRSLVALLVPTCIVLMCAGKALVTVLYGPPYAEAGTLFVLLLPGATALALHLVVDSYFAGSGFPAVTIWAPGLALALKVALNLVFVPRYGAVGAVCISSLIYVGLLTTKVIVLVREVRIPLRVLLRPTWRDVTSSLGPATAWVLRRA